MRGGNTADPPGLARFRVGPRHPRSARLTRPSSALALVSGHVTPHTELDKETVGDREAGANRTTPLKVQSPDHRKGLHHEDPASRGRPGLEPMGMERTKNDHDNQRRRGGLGRPALLV